MTTPTIKSNILVRSLVPVWSTEEAMAKITLKKNSAATAMAPNTVMIFILLCGVVSLDLNLLLSAEGRVSVFDMCRAQQSSFISNVNECVQVHFI